MPIELPSNLRYITQEEFGDIAFEVIRQAYIVQHDLGPFFDECIYRNALQKKFGPSAQIEARVGVRFADFLHEYFLDLLVAGGALFELKVANGLADVHRSQLMNYLLLCELHHGKLINFGHSNLQHEFVNAHISRKQRTSFKVEYHDWCARGLSDWLCEFLIDIGTGLDTVLYEKVACHFFGGISEVHQWVEISNLGRQRELLAAPDWALRVTTLSPNAMPSYNDNVRRFLGHTRLIGMHWINISRDQVRFQSLRN